jgi:hypothetical protein
MANFVVKRACHMEIIHRLALAQRRKRANIKGQRVAARDHSTGLGCLARSLLGFIGPFGPIFVAASRSS